MTSIDLPTLSNWLVSGFIGLIFGTVSAWITYRYQKKRDDIAWEREKEKLQKQFAHEKELLNLQHQKRLEELEQQISEQQHTQLKEQFLKGIDEPEKYIKNIIARDKQLKMSPPEMEQEPGRLLSPLPGYRKIILVVIGVIISLILITLLILYLIK